MVGLCLVYFDVQCTNSQAGYTTKINIEHNYLNILETLKEILLLLRSKVDPRVLKPYHKIISTCFIVIGCPLTESRVLPLTVPTFPQCQ